MTHVDGAPTAQAETIPVSPANRSLIGMRDGIGNKDHHAEAGGMIERERQ
jgi:hypothetical protein